jgi:general secretion pathway protein D
MNSLLQRAQALGLAGLLLATAPLAVAQDPAPVTRPAPKGASTPLQAAQQMPPPAPAQPARPNQEAPTGAPKAPALKPGEVLLNFQAAEIQGVVKAVGQMTGRNFLLDPRVKGQSTIISARQVA